MVTVIQFPERGHVRASAASRAAKRVSKSAVMPPVLAFSVDRRTDHHSDGIVSRCHHFETADARTPSSEAMASLVVQSSMTERNDVESDMSDQIRQLVLKDKDNLSADGENLQGHNVLMKKPHAVSTFKDQFTARVAYARHKAGYTQVTMAEALGLGAADDPSAQGKYHKYEKRSLMPHHLIPQFCALCDITVGWLYNGPVVARPVEKRGRKPKSMPDRRVA